MSAEPHPHRSGWPGLPLVARTQPDGSVRAYLRFAALGDSATCGVGDIVDGRPRGWSRILTEAIAQDHDLSYHNFAVSGSTTEGVWRQQLDDALDHRPHLASLVVGLNDVFRSDWDAGAVRGRLLETADRLAGVGATLLTVTFHDHTRVLGLPRILARPLAERIERLNEVYDELRCEHDGIHVNLWEEPAVYRRAFWSVDRLHPSEIGHRLLAFMFAEQLQDHGLVFTYPNLEWTQEQPTRLDELACLLSTAAPWLGRRLRDWAPELAGRIFRQLGDRS